VIVAPALERREQKEGRGWKEWEGRKTDVIENKDVVEMVVVVKATKTIIPIKVIETVETAKTIIPIEVAIIETVKAKGGVSHWNVLHRHSCHGPEHRRAVHRHSPYRTTVASHLRRRSRGCENACYHITKENEFFPVHSVIGFKKLNPSGFESIAVVASQR